MRPAVHEEGAEAAEDAGLDLRVLLIGALVVLVAGEAFMLGWGINAAAGASADVARPDRQLYFFRSALLFLLPATALNAALGAWAARRICRPLDEVRAAMAEVHRGNLEPTFTTAPDEFLAAYKEECRQMLETLSTLLYRDRGHAEEADKILSRCRALLERHERVSGEDKERLLAMLTDAKSRLSIINDHFMKGRKRAA